MSFPAQGIKPNGTLFWNTECRSVQFLLFCGYDITLHSETDLDLMDDCIAICSSKEQECYLSCILESGNIDSACMTKCIRDNADCNNGLESGSRIFVINL